MWHHFGLIAALGLAQGCARPSDTELYLRAVSDAGSYDRAWTACGRIDADSMRGDCQLAVLEAHDRLRESDCSEVSHPLWHDECLFLLAERQRAAGGLATGISTCHRTRFARKCSWHLLQDEVGVSLSDPPAVAEARLAPFVEADFLPDAGRQFWYIRFREQSAGGTPVDETDCEGLIDPMTCRDAVGVFVRTLLDSRARFDRESACAADSGHRVTVRGGPAWLAGPVTQAAEDMWVERCCVDGMPRPPGRGSPRGQGR